MKKPQPFPTNKDLLALQSKLRTMSMFFDGSLQGSDSIVIEGKKYKINLQIYEIPNLMESAQ